MSYTIWDVADVTFADRVNVTVGGGESITTRLLSKTYPPGVEEDNPFHTSWQGSITFDTTETDVYQFALIVTHAFAEGADRVDTQVISQRVTRAGEVTIPMSGFSSVSTIPSGVFPASALQGDVTITIDLSISREGSAAWICQEKSGDHLGVSFWQMRLQEDIPDVSSFITASDLPTELPPTDGSVTVAKLASDFEVTDAQVPASIARDSEIPDVSGFVTTADVPRDIGQRLLPEPSEATRGYYVRQAATDETYLLDRGVIIDGRGTLYERVALAVDSANQFHRIHNQAAPNDSEIKSGVHSVWIAFAGYDAPRLVPQLECLLFCDVRQLTADGEDIQTVADQFAELLRQVDDCYVDNNISVDYGSKHPAVRVNVRGV